MAGFAFIVTNIALKGQVIMHNIGKIIIIAILLLWLAPRVSLAESRIPVSPILPLALTFGDISAAPPVRAIEKDDHIYLNLPFLYQYLNVVATRNISNGEIFMQFGKVGIKLYPKDPAYYLNGKKIPLTVAPFEAEEQSWLPLEFLLKLGLTVKRSDADFLALDWDQNYLLSIESIEYRNCPAVVLIGTGKLEAGDTWVSPWAMPGEFSFLLLNTAKHFSLGEQFKTSEITAVRVEPDHENLKVSFQLKPGLHYTLIPDPRQPNRLVIVFSDPAAIATSPPLEEAPPKEENPPLEAKPKITVPSPNQEPASGESSLTGKTIVLDPGHGGEDFGACGRQGFLEKDNNLEIALCLKDLLEGAGASVLMTRTDDVFISLYERSFYANDAGADLFVSIHTNNHPDLSVHGVEVYSYPGRSVAKNLSQGVLESFGQTTGFKKLGAKTADFVVIRETQMPSILVEVGYLSNYQEEQTMRTPEFKEAAAEGIFEGIREFLK